MIIQETKTLIEKMENSSILTNTQMTNSEYTEELLNFQTLVAKMVFNTEDVADIRLDESILRLETIARQRGLNHDPIIRTGITQLKKVNREISICIAGRNGENRVARALEFVTRENTSTFRNVYMADKENETELDNVILTDAGIIILEVKSTKDNITISEDGRILHNNEVCNEKKTFGEKMQNKRNLLREKLEAALLERNLYLPIYIDSFLVFSTPKSTRININDQYKKEKICFHGKLPFIINDYIGKVAYTPYELAQLKEILGNLESCQKCFDLSLDFDEIRRDFAKALALVRNDETETAHNVVVAAKQKTIAQQSAEKQNNKAPIIIVGFILGIAAGVLTRAAYQNGSLRRA